jgi:dTMP kinase
MAVASKHPGVFIVIEGVDGAGKTSMAQRLVEKLNQDDVFLIQHGYSGAIYVREPGSTSFGTGVRQLFLEGEHPLAPMTEALALMAAKSQLIEEHIRPHVHRGWIVVCDRYTRTLLAYQGGLRGIPMQTLVDLLGSAGILIPPNLELFLSVTPETSAARRSSHVNAFDELAASRAEDLRKGFRDAQKALPSYRSIEIDANGEADEVYEKISSEVKRYLKFHRLTGLTLPEPILSFIPEPEPVLVEPIKDSSVPQESIHESAVEQGDIASGAEPDRGLSALEA